MILVVGLGNPGSRYADTRHNVGFRVVERVAERTPGAGAWREAFEGQFAPATIAGQEAGLLQPWTFMNASGRSVRAASSHFGLAPAEILVVHDELDLGFGQLRLKLGGGDAGHRGLRSITQELGSADYGRLRLGIGRPPPDFVGGVVDFVLQGFPLAGRTELLRVLDRAAEAVELVAGSGLPAAMSTINRRADR